MWTSLKTRICIALLFDAFFDLVISTPVWLVASDGGRYLVEEERKYNWLEALDNCARRELQLVVIDSSAKNNPLVARLKSYFGSKRDLWIGHHDEFGTSTSASRPFYSAATGALINFGYWTSGNPNNSKKKEHCVHTNNADFRWNDMPCDEYNFGYICEEHYLTTKYRKDMDGKRQTTNQKNTKLSSDFTTTQNKVKQINGDTLQNTDNALVDFRTSADEVIVDFRKSLNALLLKKPYLQAVIADVGDSIIELALEAQEKLNNISDNTREIIKDIHLNADKSTTNVNMEFAGNLASFQTEINSLLVYG